VRLAVLDGDAAEGAGCSGRSSRLHRARRILMCSAQDAVRAGARLCLARLSCGDAWRLPRGHTSTIRDRGAPWRGTGLVAGVGARYASGEGRLAVRLGDSSLW